MLTWCEEVTAGLIEKLHVCAVNKVLKASGLVSTPPCCYPVTWKGLSCHASAPRNCILYTLCQGGQHMTLLQKLGLCTSDNVSNDMTLMYHPAVLREIPEQQVTAVLSYSRHTCCDRFVLQ